MSVKFVLRHSEERGNAEYGWLKTFHSFATSVCVSCIFSIMPSDARWACRYQTTEHEKWGCLRVFNEDRVDAHTGFGLHPHREVEIFSYLVSGELEQYVATYSRDANH